MKECPDQAIASFSNYAVAFIVFRTGQKIILYIKYDTLSCLQLEKMTVPPLGITPKIQLSKPLKLVNVPM